MNDILEAIITYFADRATPGAEVRTLYTPNGDVWVINVATCGWVRLYVKPDVVRPRELAWLRVCRPGHDRDELTGKFYDVTVRVETHIGHLEYGEQFNQDDGVAFILRAWNTLYGRTIRAAESTP